MSDNILVEIINNAQAISAGIKPALYFGNNAYVHIRFAPNGTPTDVQMTTTPGDFIGFCSNHDEVAPATANNYIWARINSAAVQAAVEASMRAAEASATQSANSATSANIAKNDAQSAKIGAKTARDMATTKATEAAASATAANTAKTAAETAKIAAEAARTTATTKATEALASATAASNAKTDAQTAKTAAESARDTATTKATEASTSATTANTAKADAQAAKTAAETARDTASTKATEAANSATAATSAKTAAEGAKATAVTKAGEAATSAIEAAGYAEAAGSAHPPVTIGADTTSTVQPTAGGAVTMVDSVTRNSLGHVEKINMKTVTLPAAIDISGKLDKTGDVKDVTVSFAEQTSAQASEIASGGKLAVLIGKIKKLLTDLVAHAANNANPHGVTAAQVGARPSTWTPTAADVGARPSTWTPTAANVGADPTGTATAAVNTHNTNASAHSSLFGAKANASDLTAHTGNKSNPHGVTAAQAGARPSTWMPSAADVGARPNTWMPTAANVGADPSGTAANAISSHNTNASAHDTRFAAKADKSGAKSVTLTASGWTGSASPYTQQLSVSGVTASNNVLIAIAQAATEEQVEVWGNSKVRATAQAQGMITFTAYESMPEINLPVSIVILG